MLERSHTHHSAQVSLCFKMDYHLFASLENSSLSSGLCLAQVSLCLRKKDSDPTLDSPRRVKLPNPQKGFALRSGFLKPNMVLLRSFFPELSSTWCSAF